MRVRIKLCDLEFEAEGSTEEVDYYLKYYLSNILPAWAQTMKEGGR